MTAETAAVSLDAPDAAIAAATGYLAEDEQRLAVAVYRLLPAGEPVSVPAGPARCVTERKQCHRPDRPCLARARQAMQWGVFCWASQYRPGGNGSANQEGGGMSTTTVTQRQGFKGDAGRLARRLFGPARAAEDVVGGLAMIVVMILVMGAAGMGYPTPLNLGMAAFVFTITPPMSMLSSLMGLMGIHLPPSAAGPLMAAVRSGHISPMMMDKLGAMLMGMHVPAATVSQMGLLMSGKATNSTTASLMSMMSPSARAMVMNAMPVSVGHVVAGTILHFVFAGFLGVAFAALIGAAAWARVPAMRSPAGIISAGVIGGAIVYVILRWGLLPPVNPLMAFVPQIAFFLAHLLFGLVVGVVLAVAFRRPSVAGALPASR
jgi:hypothetical protein